MLDRATLSLGQMYVAERVSTYVYTKEPLGLILLQNSSHIRHFTKEKYLIVTRLIWW